MFFVFVFVFLANKLDLAAKIPISKTFFKIQKKKKSQQKLTKLKKKSKKKKKKLKNKNNTNQTNIVHCVSLCCFIFNRSTHIPHNDEIDVDFVDGIGYINKCS
jgi:hypothetical protein